MAQSRSMESRVGRTNQRYNEAGDRLVAGIIATNPQKTHVLLIQSTARSCWVLPKGGWELDETCSEAALREAWEEAGIICHIDSELGEIRETRTAKQISKDAPRALFRFFEATVKEEREDWPEKHKRSRKWFTYEEAREMLGGRKELREALERSSLNTEKR